MSLPSSTVNQQEVSMNGRILKRVMTVRINRQSGGWSRGSLWKISGDYFFNIFHLHYICLPSSSEIIHLFSPSDKSSPNPKLTNPLRPGRVVFLEPRRSPGAVINFGSAEWKQFSLGGSCSPAFVFQALSWGTWITTTLGHQEYLLKCFSLLWLTWFNQLCVWFTESLDAESSYWVFEEVMEETSCSPVWRIFTVCFQLKHHRGSFVWRGWSQLDQVMHGHQAQDMTPPGQLHGAQRHCFHCLKTYAAGQHHDWQHLSDTAF